MTRRSSLFFFFVCVSVTATPVFSQQWAADMFKVRDYDFGTVSHGAKAEYEFEIYNPYLEEIHVASVYASCTCTTVSMPQRTLKTYETAKILAHFNTDRFYGNRSATLTVVIDKPFPARVQLNVRGAIRNDLLFQPGSINFGMVNTGETAEKIATVSYRGRYNWQILNALCSDPNIEVSVTELQRYPGNIVYKIHTKLSQDTPTGYINNRITLMTNDGTNQKIQLMVEGLVKSIVNVSPSMLMLGSLEPGQEITKPIVIKGDKPFTIKKIACRNSGFSFAFSENNSGAPPKTVHVIPVKFKANDTKVHENIAETIKIETDAVSSTLEVPVYGDVTASSPEVMTSHQ
ncbi:MAG: DUF1573 domain-containing protein [Planctomycetaceae bacterium]|jgi:hypothetical protein|nr:DUF1573 domain-containing protein [Planctomycetaceae bacterium]